MGALGQARIDLGVQRRRQEQNGRTRPTVWRWRSRLWLSKPALLNPAARRLRRPNLSSFGDHMAGARCRALALLAPAMLMKRPDTLARNQAIFAANGALVGREMRPEYRSIFSALEMTCNGACLTFPRREKAIGSPMRPTAEARYPLVLKVSPLPQRLLYWRRATFMV